MIVRDISKSFNHNLIIENISFSIQSNDRVCLLGDNGTGKTTLIQIIAGELEPDFGFIENNYTIGYLPQHHFTEKSIGEYLHEKMQHIQDYEIIKSLGIAKIKNSVDSKFSDLSEGQKTKLYLSTLLNHSTGFDMLVLDEPTNNLDTEGLIWLENNLADFSGPILFSSHDRYFINKIATKIFELKNKSIRVFGGNYTLYIDQINTEYEAQMKHYAAQQKKIMQTKKDIQEHRSKALWGEFKFSSRDPYQKKKAAKTARIAIVREKKLNKLLNSLDFVEKPEKIKASTLNLSESTPQGKRILSVNNVNKSFNGRKILVDTEFSIYGNKHVWIKGLNGSGKSTLIKIILGEIKQDSGEIQLGNEVEIGYLFQNSTLNSELLAIDYLLSKNADVNMCYRYAANLRLDEKVLKTKISDLSRGQQTKIQLLEVLLKEPQFLILDEPTNHLEISSREDIENVLQNYDGALLIVSHDRYLIEKLEIDKVVEL